MKKLFGILLVLALCGSAFGQGGSLSSPHDLFLMGGIDGNGPDSMRIDGKLWFGYTLYCDSARYDSMYNQTGRFEQVHLTRTGDTLWMIAATDTIMKAWDSAGVTRISPYDNSIFKFSVGLVTDSVTGVRTIRGLTTTGLNIAPQNGQQLRLNQNNTGQVSLYEGTTTHWYFDADSLVGSSGTLIKGSTWGGVDMDTSNLADNSVLFRHMAQQSADTNQVIAWDGSDWALYTIPGLDSAGDNVSVDSAGDGSGVVNVTNPIFQEGTNVTITLDNDTVSIAATGDGRDTLWAAGTNRDTVSYTGESDALWKMWEEADTTVVEAGDNQYVRYDVAMILSSLNMHAHSISGLATMAGASGSDVQVTLSAATDSFKVFGPTSGSFNVYQGNVVNGTWHGDDIINDYLASGYNPSKLAQDGADPGEVLKWDGANWSPGTDSVGTGGGAGAVAWDTAASNPGYDTISYVASDTVIKISRDANDTTTISNPSGPLVIGIGAAGSRPQIEFGNTTLDSALIDSIADQMRIGGGGGVELANLSTTNATDNCIIRYEADSSSYVLDSLNGTTPTEIIQDIAGAMVGSNTESGISVTYQDADGTLDFTVQAGVTNLAATDFGDWTSSGVGCTLNDNVVATAEIVNQTIVRADMDTTGSNFVFDDAYRGTSFIADSAYATERYARDAGGDSARTWIARARDTITAFNQAAVSFGSDVTVTDSFYAASILRTAGDAVIGDSAYVGDDLVVGDSVSVGGSLAVTGNVNVTGDIAADTGAFTVLQGTGDNTYIADSLVLGATLDVNGQDVVDVDSLETAELVIGGRHVGADTVKCVQIALADPSNLTYDTLLAYQFDSTMFPYGVTITKVVYSSMGATTTDTVQLWEWDDQVGTTEAALDTLILTGASRVTVAGPSMNDNAIAIGGWLVLRQIKSGNAIAGENVQVYYTKDES